MKTNLVSLMAQIKQLEKEANTLNYNLRTNCTNLTTIELNKTENTLSECENFEEDLDKLIELRKKIAYYKGIMQEKNNTLKLTTGDTIQKALATIIQDRHLLSLLDVLVDKKSTKERVTEVNNSYYLCEKPAFNMNKIKNLRENYQEEITNLEFQISELNSQTFEIE